MNLHDRDIMERARQEGIELGLQQGISQGISQGITQGTRLKAEEAAKNIIAMNLLTHEQIAQAVGLSLEKVKELAQTNSE